LSAESPKLIASGDPVDKFIAFGRLELKWCERKILLSGWRLELE